MRLVPTGSKTMIRNSVRQRKLVCFALVVMAILTGSQSLPLQNSAKESSSISTENQQREMQEQTENPCSLCQGLELLADKIPATTVSFAGNWTCAEIDWFMQQETEIAGHAGYVGLENVTTNVPGTCRSDFFFNLAFEECCRTTVPMYECEQNAYDVILGDRRTKTYNTATPPIPNIDEKLNVSVFLQYEALEHMEVEEGTATIFVSITLKWVDPRLKWEVKQNDTCANLINVFTGHEVEKTQIWVPDLDVMNQVEGVQSMSDFKATVHSDGTVHWSLNGGIKVFCAFTGLASIPFDTLGCQVLVGSATRSHSYLIDYQIEVPDYAFYGVFDTTYNEWQPVPELGQQGYTFEGGVMYFNFYFKRATSHYMQNIVLPTVILTYLSFLTFLLDLRIGERLGFSMALALVVVAQQIVTSGMTPISDQSLWLDKFVAWSFYWVLCGVIESVIIGYVFYVREDYQARKENKILEAMSASERESMMRRAAAQANGIIIEEMDPLTIKNETESEAETMGMMEMNKYDEGKAINKEDCVVSTATKGFCLKYSLRKVDFICFLVAMISYTSFCVVMVSTGASGTWLTNQPKWMDENSAVWMIPYDQNDPDN